MVFSGCTRVHIHNLYSIDECLYGKLNCMAETIQIEKVDYLPVVLNIQFNVRFIGDFLDLSGGAVPASGHGVLVVQAGYFRDEDEEEGCEEGEDARYEGGEADQTLPSLVRVGTGHSILLLDVSQGQTLPDVAALLQNERRVSAALTGDA